MRRKILVEDFVLEYTLLIKKVKNVNLRIQENGEIVVSCNAYVPLEKVDAFVASKCQWLIERKRQLQRKKDILKSKDFFFYLGKSYPIRKIPSSYNRFRLNEGICEIYLTDENQEEKLRMHFCQQEAKKVFTEYVEKIYERMRLDYSITKPEVKIRKMKSRWGSCMPKKHQITLNLELIHFDPAFIEYVVVHEFAHFIQPNHSKAFYEVIEKILPDYKKTVKNTLKLYKDE